MSEATSQSSGAKRWLILLAVLAVAWILFRGGSSGGLTRLIGQTPPSIASKGTWLNSESLDWESLQGRVVWLEFSFLH